MRVLITGITGFAGSHLAEYALEHGAEVFGNVRTRGPLTHLQGIRRQVRLIQADLRDPVAAQTLLAESRPDRIFHLAAQSFVQVSFKAPVECLQTNAVCQLNLLEAMRVTGMTPRTLVAGSSEEYGLIHPDETPVTEDAPLRPVSPYAVSKVVQDVMGFQYWKSHGLPIVRSRAFNHTGPRSGEVFVASSFARQIAAIETGRRPPVIQVGNLEARRDFSDVRDIVRGYWDLLEGGTPGEVYNLCSGRAWTIRELLDMLIAASTLAHVTVEPIASRMRPADNPLVIGSAAKIEAAVGWRPAIPIEQTLRDLLEYWRPRVKSGE